MTNNRHGPTGKTPSEWSNSKGIRNPRAPVKNRDPVRNKAPVSTAIAPGFLPPETNGLISNNRIISGKQNLKNRRSMSSGETPMKHWLLLQRSRALSLTGLLTLSPWKNNDLAVCEAPNSVRHTAKEYCLMAPERKIQQRDTSLTLTGLLTLSHWKMIKK